MSYAVKTTDNSSAAGMGAGGTTTFSSSVAIAATATTTGANTGALQVAGGASVGGALYVGGDTLAGGNLIVGGSGGGGSITAVTTMPGLKFSIYNGYHNFDPNYASTATPLAGLFGASTGYTSDVSTISTGTLNNIGSEPDLYNAFTVEWTGYFYTGAVGGVWTFTSLSDDRAYLWVGDSAASGYTLANALVTSLTNNGPTSGAIMLLAGTYYPLRLLYGDVSSVQTMQLSFTPPGGGSTTNGTNYYFHGEVATITSTVAKYLSTVTSPVQAQLTTLASAGTTNALKSVGIGYQTLPSNLGENNVALGYRAGRAAVGASNCLYMGATAGTSNVSGSSIVAIGSSSLGSNTTGEGNTGVGAGSLSGVVGGGYNSAIGSSAGGYTLGSYNTALGASAGQAVGDTNTWNYSTAVE